MATPQNGQMLFARLHVLAPEARVVALAAAKSQLDLESVAAEFVEGVKAAEQAARQVPAGGESGDFAGYTVVCCRGILDDAQTLLSCAAADAVVLVAQRGRTPRCDLEAASLQIESAGGSLVGAVLLA